MKENFKINTSEFEFEINLPNDLENENRVHKHLTDWMKLIENNKIKNKIKEKRELRIKKIKELNAKYK